MKAFWYSSERVDDKAIYARLRLAFEHIVVPDQSAVDCFPHSELFVKGPDHTAFASIGARDELIDFESWQTPVTRPFHLPIVRKMQEFHESQYLAFRNFVEAATLNDGVLLGTRSDVDSELINVLNDVRLPNPNVKKVQIAQALLSLAGIEIALPNISPDDIDALLEAKEKYAEEVKDYQSYVAELLGGVWDVVNTDPSYEDLSRWMNFVAKTKVEPALRRVESTLRTGDRTLCQRIGYSALTELPSLVSRQLQGNHISLVSGALSSLLNVLAPKLAESMRERRTLESAFGLSYLYRLRKATK